MEETTKLFHVKMKDAGQALVNAVIAGVVIALAGVAQQSGFDVFSADWAAIGKIAFNAAFAAFVGSLGKDFLTTKEGNLLGAVKIR